MEFKEAKALLDKKLGDWKIMALASCVDNKPMVRNVSCLIYNDKIYMGAYSDVCEINKSVFLQPLVSE